MVAPTVTPLPTPLPSRQEPETFASATDALIAALPTFRVELDAVGDFIVVPEATVDGLATSASLSASSATSSAVSAATNAKFKGAWASQTGSATIPYAVSHNDKYWVLLSSISDITLSEPSSGNSAWAEFNVYNDIRKPFPVSPLDGVTGVLPTVTLEASPYAPSVSSDARSYRRFELTLAADTTFSSPVFTSEVDADSVAVTPDLTLEASYIWRCKDVSSRNESFWMDTQQFTITGAFVVAPTLTVEGSPSSVPESPTLTSGAFSTVPADSDTHLNTDWQVLDGVTVVYESLADASNLLSITVPAGNLSPNTTYTFRVRHRGNTLGVSTYTEVTATTLETFDIVPLLAVAHATSPYITIYNQEVDTFTKLADPSSPPTGIGFGVAFSNDDTYTAVAHGTSPFITIYKRSEDTFTKLADPAILPTSTGYAVAFSSADTYMAVAHGGAPNITIYKRSGDTFTKLADPAILPTNTGNTVAFSSDDTYMAVAHGGSPFITVYKRSGDTFTKLADPAILPTGTGTGVTFSSDDTYMAVCHTTSPFIAIYKRSGDTFTKLANPATLPTGNAGSVAFSNDNTHMVVSHFTSPFITIYKRSGDTFTKLADPATLPTGLGRGVAFSSDDTYMAVGHFTSPFITIYKRSVDTFTKLADPATLPPDAGRGVAFSNTGFPQ